MKKIILAVLMFNAVLLASAQPVDKAELERERQSIQKELKELQGMYNNVKGQSKQALSQLNVINRKISLREKYISNINKELRMIDDDLYLSNLEIYRLQKQLDTLKSSYAKTIVYAYKNRSSYDYLNFVFSATSFNDAIKRIAYLKSYREYRKKQAATILETQDLIQQRQKQQIARKDQKSNALKSETEQRRELDGQKKEKAEVMTKLKSQEKDLQKQLAAKKKKDRDLQNAITAIIRRDIENAKKEAAAKAKAADEEAKKNAASNPTASTNNSNTGALSTPAKPKTTPVKERNFLELNDKEFALGKSFGENKGRLPWPVDNGVVSLHFGNNKISDHLNIDNPGITIATPSQGQNVKAVFDGEVSVIHNMGDGSMMITIKHGKYYTAYSNVTNVSVSKGESVKRGQVIGKTGRAEEGSGGQLDFILMNEMKNVNPEQWLSR